VDLVLSVECRWNRLSILCGASATNKMVLMLIQMMPAGDSVAMTVMAQRPADQRT